MSGKRVLSSYIGRVGYRYLSYDTYSLVTQESTLLLLGESAPNLVILKFDTLSPSRKRVLSYKSAVTGKRVLSYTSAVTGKRVLSSYIGRVVLIET